MTTTDKPGTGWLDWTEHHDLSGSRGNGPFGTFLGTILHVNQSEEGTSVDWFASGTDVNPDSVTPTFQVYKGGHVVQFLPLDWQPWCQVNGNFSYGAIETAGLASEPLTHEQVMAIGRLLAAYRDIMGMHLAIADHPGARGLGTHEMGGPDWGGHPCPGTLRAGQRSAILAAVPSIGTDWLDTVDEATLRKIVREEATAAATAVARDGVTVRNLVDWAGHAHNIETFLSGHAGYKSTEKRGDDK